jgi:hypothetical protein
MFGAGARFVFSIITICHSVTMLVPSGAITKEHF